MHTIMKTMCPPAYHNDYVVNHALGHMINGTAH